MALWKFYDRLGHRRCPKKGDRNLGRRRRPIFFSRSAAGGGGFSNGCRIRLHIYMFIPLLFRKKQSLGYFKIIWTWPNHFVVILCCPNFVHFPFTYIHIHYIQVFILLYRLYYVYIGYIHIYRRLFCLRWRDIFMGLILKGRIRDVILPLLKPFYFCRLSTAESLMCI